MKKRLVSGAAGILLAAAMLVFTGQTSFAGNDWADSISPDRNAGQTQDQSGPDGQTQQSDGSDWSDAHHRHLPDRVFGNEWD